MASIKETLKKRWLLIVAYFFQVFVPIVLLIELFAMNQDTPKLPAFLFILGLLYLGFIAKLVKEKISKLKEGTFKLFCQEVTFLVPFGVVALLVYITQHLFDGFSKWCLLIVGCIAFGSILKIVEYAVNRKFIYEQKIYSLAKEQVDIEKAKENLKKELEEIE